MSQSTGPDAVPVAHADPGGHLVLVPLDGSELAERALPVALWAAAGLGSAVSLLAVAIDDEEAARFEAYLAEVAARPAATAGPARIEGTVVDIAPDAAQAIQRAAEGNGPALVCLASHGWGRAAGPLGSVATVVTAGLGRPVLVVGPNAVPGVAGSPVAACVDGSEASEAVLAPALAWATALGAPLQVLTVFEPVPEPDHQGRYRRRHGPEVGADVYVDALAERVRATGLSGAAGAPGAEIPVEGVAVPDPISASDGLAAHLRDHALQLLVVSTRARTGLARFVLGSQAARIVAASPVPVLTVPLPGA